VRGGDSVGWGSLIRIVLLSTAVCILLAYQIMLKLIGTEADGWEIRCLKVEVGGGLAPKAPPLRESRSLPAPPGGEAGTGFVEGGMSWVYICLLADYMKEQQDSYMKLNIIQI